MKPLWGLTGGIASGKSTVLNHFREKEDVLCLVADDIAKVIMTRETVMDRLAEIFGPEIFSVYGDYPLDRAWLANEIYSHPGKKKALEALVHPLVWAEVERQRAEADENISFVLVESAIIFETNSQNRFDGIISVTCSDRQLQLGRATRRGTPANVAILLADLQMAPSEIAKMSDYVIQTDGLLACTKQQAEAVYGKIKEAKDG